MNFFLISGVIDIQPTDSLLGGAGIFWDTKSVLFSHHV